MFDPCASIESILAIVHPIFALFHDSQQFAQHLLFVPMLRPEYRKLYENTKKNSLTWGPQKAVLLADLWTQIEKERHKYVGKKAGDVGSCASMAQMCLAQSVHFFSLGYKEHNKGVKCLSQIATSAANIQLLAGRHEAAAEIMFLMFQMGCIAAGCCGQVVAMWLLRQFPGSRRETLPGGASG